MVQDFGKDTDSDWAALLCLHQLMEFTSGIAMKMRVRQEHWSMKLMHEFITVVWF